MYKFYTIILGMWDSHIRKLMFIMRLTIVLILTTMLHINASTFAQKITYVKRDAPLHVVFKEIKKQTGYHVVWNDEKFAASRTLNADFKNADLSDVMAKVLDGVPFTYTILKKTIVIREKPDIPVNSIMGRAANINVRGIIHDDKAMPLAGATVTVKGTHRSTKTNEQGEFNLENLDENASLIISYLGFESLELKAVENHGIIRMVQHADKLQEVEINAGYYTVKEKERTGSISRVSGETIAKQPVGNPLAALIGRMPGVNIQQNDGLNGGNFTIEIRGRNSLRNSTTDNGNQPLYLIDGVPYSGRPMAGLAQTTLTQGLSPFSSLAASDIQSIEVLKDADATAIYGSRGANGVVLITTKRAKTGGMTSFDVNAFHGFSRVSRKLDMMKTSQYLEMRNEAFKNDGASPAATDYDLNGTWDASRETDWQDELIGGAATLTTLQMGLNGGNESTQVSMRSNYSKNGSVNPGSFSITNFSNALAANHASANKKFKSFFTATYSLQHNTLPRFDLAKYINLAPNSPVIYNPDGTLNWALNTAGAATWTNPFGFVNQPYENRSANLISNGILSYELAPGLRVKATGGYTNLSIKEDFKTPISAQAPSITTTGYHEKYFNTIETWIIEPQLNYDKAIGASFLQLLVGSTFQKDSQNSENIITGGYTDDLLLDNMNAAPIKNTTLGASQYKYNALFARINYRLHGKYFLNLTARRDGSSRFGDDRQFSNFGAIGIAWIFSEATWLKELSFLSFGKIRSSYGITGNDQIPNYGYLETFSATEPYKDGSGLFPNRIANPDYSWETNRKFELAADLGFIQDKIQLSASWYSNRSSNQLVGYTLPDIAGFPSIQYNLPATVANTGWEFEVNTSNIRTKTFSWKSAFNVSIPKNKLLSYPNIEGSTYAATYTVGESLFTPIVYNYIGVNDQTGVYNYSDRDGNGIYNVLDRRAAGKPLTSHLYGGINNSISYKNISLDFFIQFVSKTAKYEYVLFGAPGVAYKNQPVNILDRWQRPGDMGEFQKYSRLTSAGSTGQRFGYLNLSDRFADASFARLKNVSLSWDFPNDQIRKMGIKDLRCYVQGQNLYTLTKYLGDPETLSILSLPSMTTVTAGIQFTL